MKALLIILTCIAFAMVLKVINYFCGRRNMKNVGAKSNRLSRDIPKIDITNEEELKLAREYYKDMAD